MLSKKEYIVFVQKVNVQRKLYECKCCHDRKTRLPTDIEDLSYFNIFNTSR